MSWHYLQEQAEASWAGSSLAGAPSALLRLIPTAEASCSPDSGTDASTSSPSGITCEPSTGDRGGEQLTLSLADSPARTSPQRVKVADLPGHVRALSSRCSELLKRYGLRLCSRKTARAFVPRGWPQSSRSLSAWGTWDESGYWELGTSVRRMSAGACGSLPTLPTPQAWDWKDGGSRTQGKRHAPNLTVVLNNLQESLTGGMLPTPTASLYGSSNNGCPRDGRRTEYRTKGKKSLESLTGGIYPALREWMMGWPIGWTALEPLGTDRFREWLHSHGKC